MSSRCNIFYLLINVSEAFVTANELSCDGKIILLSRNQPSLQRQIRKFIRFEFAKKIVEYNNFKILLILITLFGLHFVAFISYDTVDERDIWVCSRQTGLDKQQSAVQLTIFDYGV